MTEHKLPQPILQIKSLNVEVNQPHNLCTIKLLNEINLDIKNEVLALIGESGSGKSTLAKAIFNILPNNMTISAHKMIFTPDDGTTEYNLLSTGAQKLIRGSAISMVLQDPRYALNPSLSLSKQMNYAYKGALKGEERQQFFINLLESVGLQAMHLQHKPAQLSGGMGQRFMIALALINQPKLIIADEPTSALDAEMKAQVMQLLIERCRSSNIGLLLISHDLTSVLTFADRIIIMKSGEIVDCADAKSIESSKHPYTQVLFSCRPSGRTYKTQLASN